MVIVSVWKPTVVNSICFILFYQGLGGQLDYFGLWIDNSFNHGHSKAVPKCTTYGSPQLSGQTQFEVEALEVWAVGPEKKNRLSYADDDDREVSKLIVFSLQYRVLDLRKSGTVLPAKSDSDILFCLQLFNKILTCTLHLSYCESIYHMCINPILQIGLIHK